MEQLYDYSDLRNDIFRQSPEARDVWTRSALKRRIAAMFIRMRRTIDAPQSFVAEVTRWDKGYVSRLEGTQGGVPDINTITKFAEACGLTIALVVCEKRDGEARVIDAFSLFREPTTESLDEQNYFVPPDIFSGVVGSSFSIKEENREVESYNLIK